MATQCTEAKLIFHDLDSREVVGRFDGGEITSDAGAVLLREVEKRSRILGRMSECCFARNFVTDFSDCS